MAQMNEFEVTVNSLAEQVVAYVGREHLKFVTIWMDELSATADISIVLERDTWDEQQRAIDKMIEIRGMFLDDLAIDYRFDSEESLSRRGSTKAEMLQIA